MSATGDMGAVESFVWVMADGRKMTVTVNRGLLALLLEKKLRQRGKGGRVRARITRCEGAIVARVTPDAKADIGAVLDVAYGRNRRP